QLPHQPEDLRVEVVEPELEGGRLAVAPDRFLHLDFHFLDDLFDPRGVDAAVGDEPRDGLPRDLPPERIERPEDDGARRVVDDGLDARGLFERADVAPFAADDASFHVVAGEVDDRHRRLDGVLGGAALDGVGDDLLGALAGGLARLGFEPLDEVGRVAPRVGLDLPEQDLARFLRREARDALQLALPFDQELFAARGGLLGAPLQLAQRGLAPTEVALELFGPGDAIRQRASTVGERLLEAGDLLLTFTRALLRVRDEHVALLPRFEQRFLLQGFGVAREKLAHLPCLFLGPADGFCRDTLAGAEPPDE